MAEQDVYDKLARILKDIRERFPSDGFTHHQRLKGLLSDHLPDAQREIRIVLDAVDEGVVGVLTDTPEAQLGMQIDRLILRLETSRGIREDISRQVIQAFAFALGLGELPSTSARSTPRPAPVQGDDWVGVSEAVRPTPPPPPPPPAPPESDGGSKLGKGNNRMLMIGAAVLVLGALYFVGQQQDAPPPQQQQEQGGQPPEQPQGPQEQPPGQQPQPQGPQQQQPQGPQQQPQQQPTVQPGPQPQQQPQQPRQQPQQQQQQPAATADQWYDPYGNVWAMSFSGAQMRGTSSFDGAPVQFVGIVDQQTGYVQYQVFDAGNQMIAQGQGQYTDQTHVAFTTWDTYGQIVGQGQFHINHPPSQ